ncbi:MAG TPA: DUF6159 family protein [Solirubrobacteraceae bacterium]|nr:DUF6159 family protein [Solirubrobacteraceae bacterium]
MAVSQVRIHCWSCARNVEVDEGDPQAGLAAAGWALSHGETYCPECAQARGLAPLEPPLGPDGEPLPAATEPGGYPSSAPLEPFPVSPYASGESRFARSLRMLSASWTVLRENPGLMAFPAISVVLSLIVGIVCFGTWTPHTGAGTGGNARDALLLPSLIAAYPLTFISVYFSVALAEVLAGRLDGKGTTTAEGLSAANSRIGLIAAWSLLVCTVGLILRLLEERLPLAGRIAASLFGLAWSLVTAFAVPVLAYEGLGPLETVKRSGVIFKRRWGAQIGGSIGIGFASVVVAVPLALLFVIGLSTPGGGGAALALAAGAGLFALGAAVAAMEQIYRVFVYRSAVGLDTSAGPFSQEDLRSPLSRRGRG